MSLHVVDVQNAAMASPMPPLPQQQQQQPQAWPPPPLPPPSSPPQKGAPADPYNKIQNNNGMAPGQPRAQNLMPQGNLSQIRSATSGQPFVNAAVPLTANMQGNLHAPNEHIPNSG